MRKLAITLALASTALATPAVARDHSWYVGVEGGAMLVEDTHFDYTKTRAGVTVLNVADGIVINHKTGLDGDLIGGYDFGFLRAEAEIGYKRAGLKDVRTSAGVTNPSGDFRANGHASALSSMANLLLDFGDDNGWNGYVGGGAGVARVKYDVSVPSLGSGVSDRDSRFAWQAIAGVRKAISPNMDIGLKYRYFTVNKLRFNDTVVTGVENYNGRFRSHSLLASLIFNFAAPPPPPPPPQPPPPPPPPPPATQTCPDGSVILATDTCPPPPPPPPPPPEPTGERG